MTTTLGQDESLIPVEEVHARRFDEELVVLDLVGGDYYALNPVGSRIWEGLSAGQSPAKVAATLTSQYSVEYAQALNDCLALATQLVARGLLRRNR